MPVAMMTARLESAGAGGNRVSGTKLGNISRRCSESCSLIFLYRLVATLRVEFRRVKVARRLGV
jgi:hypothetical protein